MSELYIVDEEFEKYKEKIQEIDAAIEERLTEIITQLSKACTGVSEGSLHTNLCTYVQNLSKMKGQLSYMTSEMQQNTDKFIEEIAEIDTLYDE